MQEKFGRKLRTMLSTAAALALVSGNALAGWTLNYAYDINDKGQIVGYGKNGTSSSNAAFLLTPDAAPVPIPASLPLLGSGLAALGFMRRKRKDA
jgi:probable HAF family extracellular repeat protein